jgi:cephalosporin hydroxylase
MFIHIKYCSDLVELRNFLKKISPDQLITVTEKIGYTVIWNSDEEHDLR